MELNTKKNLEPTSVGERPGASTESEAATFGIRGRILVAFSAILIALVGIGATSAFQHHRSALMVDTLQRAHLPLAKYLSEAQAFHEAWANRLDDMEASSRPNAARMRAVLATRPSTLKRIRSALNTAEQAQNERRSSSLENVRHLIISVESEFEKTAPLYEKLGKLTPGDSEASVDVAQLLVSEKKVATSFAEAWESVQQDVVLLSYTLAQRETRMTRLVAAASLLALLAGVVVALWIRSLLRPLPILHAQVMSVARGDLSKVGIPTKRNDEIARLSRAFDTMVQALGVRDARIRERNDTVAGLQALQEGIITQLSTSVMLLDAGMVRVANPASESLFGLGAGRPIGDSPSLQRLLETIRKKKGADEAAYVIPELALDQRKVRVALTAFRGGEGGELLVVDDITDAVQTKQKLVETEKLAAVGRMAAHVTHEVRNPLSSIGLNVELLAEDLDTDNVSGKKLIAAIHKEVDRLHQLTDQYLRLARLPAPRKTTVNISDYLQDLLSFVDAEMSDADIVVRLALEKSSSVSIDPDQMRQALLNILRNAREAMPGGGKLHISSSGDETQLEIRIADTGAGIPNVAENQAFDLFFTTKEHGTGLGLPLTRQIVIAHGGRLRWEPRDGGGTTFVIELPLDGHATSADHII